MSCRCSSERDRGWINASNLVFSILKRAASFSFLAARSLASPASPIAIRNPPSALPNRSSASASFVSEIIRNCAFPWAALDPKWYSPYTPRMIIVVQNALRRISESGLSLVYRKMTATSPINPNTTTRVDQSEYDWLCAINNLRASASGPPIIGDDYSVEYHRRLIIGILVAVFFCTRTLVLLIRYFLRECPLKKDRKHGLRRSSLFHVLQLCTHP